MNEQDFVSYNLHFGHNKTLLFTRMTDEQKEQSINEGIPTKQGYKSYDKATQKKLLNTNVIQKKWNAKLKSTNNNSNNVTHYHS